MLWLTNISNLSNSRPYLQQIKFIGNSELSPLRKHCIQMLSCKKEDINIGSVHHYYVTTIHITTLHCTNQYHTPTQNKQGNFNPSKKIHSSCFFTLQKKKKYIMESFQYPTCPPCVNNCSHYCLQNFENTLGIYGREYNGT